MKKFRLGFLLGIGLLLFSACAKSANTPAAGSEAARTEKTAATREQTSKRGTPTVFIHGYSGGESSFGGMLSRFEKAGINESRYQIFVSANGELSTNGTLSGKHPLVQLLFEDNRNNEWNQADWLQAGLQLLKKDGVSQVNLVGHSMGGVDIMRYLTTYTQNAQVPKVAKIALIAAPLNDFIDNNDQSFADFEANGPAEQGTRFREFAQKIGNLPAGLPILVIAGDNGTGSDGAVPVKSALALDALAKKQKLDYHSELLEGEKIQHSELHENKKVDQLLSRFLWDE
ncbi:MAG: alpha/beta fold hydrolase [Enterococcaceae bacterium]|jgi:uncharacterized alpha/beta hydrolase family protein|nr:alpha/beta fold hydrolase [Enterococcaceae bacterium]MCI1919818.1 alpha/beta fold hydrolase [Enterococcaceae bacterium]